MKKFLAVLAFVVIGLMAVSCSKTQTESPNDVVANKELGYSLPRGEGGINYSGGTRMCHIIKRSGEETTVPCERN
jgi:hypothetical protein